MLNHHWPSGHTPNPKPIPEFRKDLRVLARDGYTIIGITTLPSVCQCCYSELKVSVLCLGPNGEVVTVGRWCAQTLVDAIRAHLGLELNSRFGDPLTDRQLCELFHDIRSKGHTVGGTNARLHLCARSRCHDQLRCATQRRWVTRTVHVQAQRHRVTRPDWIYKNRGGRWRH